MRTTCNGPRRTAIQSRNTIVLQVFADTTLDKEVDRTLVSADDLTITLPNQPLAGKTVEVATVSTGTKVVPGCPTGCSCDDDDSECDTFAASTDAVPITEVEIPQFGSASFTFFPGPAGAESCECGPGSWVFCVCGPTGATG
jgi:hypothetical protein